jgi:hypothetical protein
MRYCPRCARETEDRYLFCPFCGSPLEPSTVPDEERVTEEAFRSFIGPNADYYLNQFKKFHPEGMGGFSFTWNWPAFFFGIVWMLYRKMVLWALVSFLVLLTPVTLPVLMVVWGLTGNYLYYVHCRRRILEMRRRRAAGIPGPTLAEKGGVNRWVWFIGAFLVLAVLVLGIVSGLLLIYLIREVFFYVPQMIQT